MRIAFFGVDGKLGRVVASALESQGHDVVDARVAGPAGCDAAVDFTRPDAVLGNVEQSVALGVPVVIGTTGFDFQVLDARAREAGVPCFHAPNFAQGAVLMMRFAAAAAKKRSRSG